MRTYKPRNRDKLLEQRNQNALTQLLKSKVPLEEKREMVRERNEFLFVFGDHLKVFNQAYQSYEDFINHQYIGEAK